MNKLFVLGMALAGAAFAAGSFADDHGHAETPAVKPTKAICIMQAKAGSKVTGTVVFQQVGDHVEITGEIHGLTPGLHGFHVHEFGDLSGDDGMATGGHFNPEGSDHGGPDAEHRHVGDLGNVKADEKGVAKFTIKDSHVELSGPHSIIGRGLVVHAKEDDLKSQPSGNAGDRVGVGVIGIAKPDAPAKK